MALLRKQKKRQRDKQRRQRQPRAEYLAASKTQIKPWEQEGISRRTRYRKQRGTGLHHINLIQTERTLVPKEEQCTDAGECVRVSTATPAGQVQTCPEFLTADEASWLVDAICPPSEPIGYEAAA